MKHFKSLLIVLIIGFNLNAHTYSDSLKNDPLFRDHLSLKETFFGNEDAYQVCYPEGHRNFFMYIFIFLCISVVLAIFIINIKSNTNRNLKSKNSIISEQNKNLLDSLNYSKRIQEAILPHGSIEDVVLKNGFVLYKPKDIVSGDFYWLHKCKDVFYFAVIDCTGHGVLGALLTMLAYNSINKTIIEKEIKDPTLILDNMNNEIKSALKQNKDNPIQDSMEIGIVVFNTSTNEAMFAGANTSLTYIQNNELKIAEGGKCSVGSVQDENIILPTTHHLKFNKGDAFYVYTDGYADQFGGPKGKKFKYKQLEDLLLANHSKSTQHQKEILNNTIENWKGNLEQVDDITVLGYLIN